jgi:HK97 family phage portal protein
MTTLLTTDGLMSVAPAKSFPYPGGFRTLTGATPGSMPLLTREQTATTYEGMFRNQPWVNAVVTKLVKGIARLPLHTFKYTDPEMENRVRVKNDSLPKLLANPFPRGSSWTWKAATAWNLFVHGNALLLKVRGGAGQPPSELWPIPWRRVGVWSDGPFGPVIAYIYYTSDGKMIKLDPSDVVHFRLNENPGPIGIAPLEPLRRTLALEDAAQVWAGSYFENGASPSGIFKTANKLDDRTLPRLRAELDAVYGGVENAGRFAIFDQGLEFSQVSQSPADAALIAQRKLHREEVCGVYDVAPPLVGILDRATFSNITELHAALYQDALGPPLTMIEETLWAQLIAPEPMWTGQFSEFYLAEVLKAKVLEQAQAYQALVTAGVWTPNDARRADNKPPMDDPDADKIWMPLNMIPIGGAAEDVALRARAAVAVAGTAPALPAAALSDSGLFEMAGAAGDAG